MSTHSIETFEIDLSITETSSAVRNSLSNIGKVIRSEKLSQGSIIIEGKTNYGFQSVSLHIRLETLNETNTKLTFNATGDDAFGKGAQSAKQRFINELALLISSDTSIDVSNEQSFEKRTGFTKPKLALYVVGFLFLVFIFTKFQGSNEPSIDTAVSTVQRYLKENYLRDPSSYEYVGNYGFEKLPDGNYKLFHEFRANNGFGGKTGGCIAFMLSKDCRRVVKVLRVIY